MNKVNRVLDGLTNAALKRLVKQLLTADDSKEQSIVKKILKDHKNDLADLDEEMHGKPKTPKVEKDDLPEEEDDD